VSRYTHVKNLVILSGAKDLPLEPARSSKGNRNLLPYLTLTALVLFIFATQAIAQGCAQCLDSTRATPPAVQAAYRHAILLLGSFGASFFIAGALLLRHNRR
jgi:hypothetical protein